MGATTIEQKLSQLKKTIPFKWRVQSLVPNKTNPTHAIMIPYIDARDVQEQLDSIIGASCWQNDFKDIGGRLFGGIGILINGQWVWKWDRGVASQTEKEKGEASDCFKRAAVEWGINRDAYAVGTVKLKVKEYMGKHYPCDDAGKFMKGKDLYDKCNSMAKITELENYDIEISDTLLADRYEAKPELTPSHPDWGHAVKGMQNGATIDQIISRFTLSEENRLKLMDEAL